MVVGEFKHNLCGRMQYEHRTNTASRYAEALCRHECLSNTVAGTSTICRCHVTHSSIPLSMTSVPNNKLMGQRRFKKGVLYTTPPTWGWTWAESPAEIDPSICLITPGRASQEPRGSVPRIWMSGTERMLIWIIGNSFTWWVILY